MGQSTLYVLNADCKGWLSKIYRALWELEETILPQLSNARKFIHVDDLLREIQDLECGMIVYLFVQSLL
jgi:hypothetical protein